MRERTNHHFYLPLLGIARFGLCLGGFCLILASCSGLLEPDRGSKDTGSVVISLPDSAAARAAVFEDDEKAALLPQLSYELELHGPGGTIKRAIAEGSSSLILDLAIGNWTVNVTAFYRIHEHEVEAGKNAVSGGADFISFIVEKGKKTSVPVQMEYQGAVLIHDEATLKKIGSNGEYWVIKDIEVSGWKPLPTPFAGTLIGFEHTITINGLHNDALGVGGTSTENSLGLFSTLGATAQVSYLNLALDWNYETFTFSSGVNQYIGGLAGKAVSGSVITGCKVSGTLAFKANASDITLGGLVGDLAGSVIGSGGEGVYGEGVHIKGIGDGFEFLAGGIAGSLNGGFIRDSRVEGTIETDDGGLYCQMYAGGLAGRSESGGVIENSSAAMNVGFTSISSPGVSFVYAGGLVGCVDASPGGSISSSHAEGAVTIASTDYVFAGGLAGLFQNPSSVISSIENSYATGNVTVSAIETQFVTGGLIGNNVDCSIISCHASGNVTANGRSSAVAWAGGLIGWNYNASPGSSVSIDSSYALGNVTVGYTVPPDDEIYAGGLIGQNHNSGAGSTIVSSYAVGFVNAKAGTEVYSGGLVGDIVDSKIEDSYAQGNVTAGLTTPLPAFPDGKIYAGGLLGRGVVTTSEGIMSSYAEGSVTVENTRKVYTGGLAGSYTGSADYVSGAVDIGNCYTTNTADVTFFDIDVSGSEVYTGGLIGQAIDSTIESCHAEGGVTGEGSYNPSSTTICAGGLIGQYGLASVTSNPISITQSYAAGNIAVAVDSASAVLPQQVFAGGLVGDVYYIAGSDSVTVSSCYAEGSVDAEGAYVYSGGLVGGFNNSNAGSGIDNCYTRGTVSASIGGTLAYYSYAGGIAGLTYSHIEKCYAAGNVTANSSNILAPYIHAGGIVGMVDNNPGINIEYCAALMESVNVSYGSDCNRIAGYPGSPPCTFTSNYGRLDCVPNTGTTSDEGGGSAPAPYPDGFTSETGIFYGTFSSTWLSSSWKLIPGQLPKLQWET